MTFVVGERCVYMTGRKGEEPIVGFGVFIEFGGETKWLADFRYREDAEVYCERRKKEYSC